jgi:phosphate transport system protein
MTRHFHDEIQGLKQHLLRMALLVEEGIRNATEALVERDLQKAQQVMNREKDVNHAEIEVDEMGHSLLALDQPVAVDLRRLIMILKINTDLERMGDHAVNIAQRAIRAVKEPKYPVDPLIPKMANAASSMLKNALDAFVHEDVQMANAVLASDDEVDRYGDEIYEKYRALMEGEGGAVPFGVDMIMVGYNLERVADLASNIAEDTIYIKQGREVRHHHHYSDEGKNPTA